MKSPHERDRETCESRQIRVKLSNYPIAVNRRLNLVCRLPMPRLADDNKPKESVEQCIATWLFPRVPVVEDSRQEVRPAALPSSLPSSPFHQWWATTTTFLAGKQVLHVAACPGSTVTQVSRSVNQRMQKQHTELGPTRKRTRKREG